MRNKELTSKIMSSVKSKDTLPEITLAKHMWRIGLRYRKQHNIYGKPDFVFLKKKSQFSVMVIFGTETIGK